MITVFVDEITMTRFGSHCIFGTPSIYLVYTSFILKLLSHYFLNYVSLFILFKKFIQIYNIISYVQFFINKIND
jgi:hypothetical protein